MREYSISSLPIVNDEREIISIKFSNAPDVYDYKQLDVPVVIMAGGKGTVDLIIGKVVEIHVADEIILPNGKLDYRKLRLIGRAGYWDYGVMEDTFAMKVPGVSAARMAAMEGRKPNEADLEKDKKENSL